MLFGVSIPITIVCTFGLTVLSVGIIKRLLERANAFDVPNERSMHSKSTVRGGGIGVALVLLLTCVLLNLVLDVPVRGFIVLICGLSALGLIDDLAGLPWWLRLGAQVVLAAVFVAVSGGFSGTHVAGVAFFGIQAEYLLAVGWIVYMCNIYNFMDGIDGIAAGFGAVCTCVMGIWLVMNTEVGSGLFCFAVMSACLGFLVWNWEPAKIFLGDSGSVMLGGLLAGIALTGQREHGFPFAAYLILLSVFLGDSTYTLVRRLVRGEKIWLAHRQHLYQRAVAAGLSHAAIASLVVVLTIILSIPATLVAFEMGYSSVWVILAVSVLLAVFRYIRIVERRSTQT